jgi:iron complex transport system permease protein
LISEMYLAFGRDNPRGCPYQIYYILERLSLLQFFFVYTSMNNKTTLPALPLLFLLTIIVAAISICLGRYAISFSDLFRMFTGKLLHSPVTWSKNMETVVFMIRLPRVAVALMVGAALAMAGTSYQGLFRNPMISPDILGASAGAGFGACLGILFSFGPMGIQLSAFLFGLVAVALVYLISTIIGRGNAVILVLVLTGVLISTLFGSLTSMLKIIADPSNKLPTIVFWLMGGLSSVNQKDVLLMSIPLLVGSVPLMLLRWKMNVLAFGEEEAQAIGVNTRKIRPVIIICATLITAAAVSVSGVIGWVGLIIPHMARFLVGPNHKKLLPASMLMGGAFLVIVDDVARCSFGIEIPLGILTSFIGAPFFIFLLTRGRKCWV